MLNNRDTWDSATRQLYIYVFILNYLCSFGFKFHVPAIYLFWCAFFYNKVQRIVSARAVFERWYGQLAIALDRRLENNARLLCCCEEGRRRSTRLGDRRNYSESLELRTAMMWLACGVAQVGFQSTYINEFMARERDAAMWSRDVGVPRASCNTSSTRRSVRTASCAVLSAVYSFF